MFQGTIIEIVEHDLVVKESDGEVVRVPMLGANREESCGLPDGRSGGNYLDAWRHGDVSHSNTRRVRPLNRLCYIESPILWALLDKKFL